MLKIIKKLRKYLIICSFSLILFSILHFTSFFDYRISVFTSFMLLPALILIITKEKLNLGKLNKNFLLSIFVYFLFFLWIIVYYPLNNNFFSNFDLENESIIYTIKWNIITYLHVSTTDFFTKRIVQYKAMQVFGEIKGFLTQLLIWMVAHAFEFFWLKDLMGIFFTFLFLFASGFITGFLYVKTKDIIGQMTGHWFINFLVMIIVSFM